MVDVVNLPRLPLPELVKRLAELKKLIESGWIVRLYDDVPKCTFVFVAQSPTGLATKVTVPYEYLNDLLEDDSKSKVKELWAKQSELFSEMTEMLLNALEKQAQKVTTLQEAGIFDGKK
jgi:hypothetical protein